MRRAFYLSLLLLSTLSTGCGGGSEPYSMPEDPVPPPAGPPQGTEAPATPPASAN